MKAIVLGSGTSSGVPTIGCRCRVCRSTHPKDTRLRASVLLRDRHRAILIDCGSDFRQQALAHRIDRLDAVLVTHSHADHISGIDELRIYNFRQRVPMPIYARRDVVSDLRRRFDYAFSPPQEGGGVPELRLVSIRDRVDTCGLSVEVLSVMHGIIPIVGFRFGEFAYITDVSVISPESMERLRGVRYLILNALRRSRHPTHFNIQQAVAVSRRLAPERTWFTHICHDLGHEETNARLPAGIELAYDGLEFDFTPAASRTQGKPKP